MKLRTAIFIAATAAACTALTIGLVEGCSSSGDSQTYQQGTFTAAVPCKFQGRQSLCATVNGVPVIITGTGYKPLTAAQVKQVEDSAPTEAAYPHGGSGSQQDPAYDPAASRPEPVAPEHVSEPDPVEVEPHIVIVDGK